MQHANHNEWLDVHKLTAEHSAHSPIIRQEEDGRLNVQPDVALIAAFRVAETEGEGDHHGVQGLAADA